MGRDKRALAGTLLIILAIVLAAGLRRHGPHAGDETVRATFDEGATGRGGGGASMVSPRRLSMAWADEPPTAEAADLAASRGTAPAGQEGAAAPTPVREEIRIPESAAATASREPVASIPAPRERRAAAAGSSEDGRLPGLVIDSRNLGLDRYLHLAESTGALFVLTKDNRLGSRVSLRRGVTVPGGLPGHLVRERPHVITDPRLLQRLDTMSLPADARRDRLVLLLTQRADRALWQGVADALSRKGLASTTVALVTGAYVESGGRITVRFDAATLRDGGSTVRLSEAGGREDSS